MGLHLSAVGENGEKFYGPEEERNDVLYKLIYILLGCGQAVLEILLCLLFQFLEIENEITIATLKAATVAAPLVITAFSTHEQLSSKRIGNLLREAPISTTIPSSGLNWR